MGRRMHEQVLPVLGTLGLQSFVKERFQVFPKLVLGRVKPFIHVDPFTNRLTQTVHGLLLSLEGEETKQIVMGAGEEVNVKNLYWTFHDVITLI